MEKKKCNWCFKEFLEDREEKERKPYCPVCQKRCHRECKRCHKPYTDLHLFKYSDAYCDSCYKTVKKRNMKTKKGYEPVSLVDEEGDEEFSSGGSSSEYMSEEDEEQRTTAAAASAADEAKTANVEKHTDMDDERGKQKVQDENQKKMNDLMRALTEHQREAAVEKRPVGKPKRKYAKRESAQDRLAKIQTDFLKSFFELRKIERAGGAKPQSTCLFFA